MAKNQKISGNIKGNKLNISISSSIKGEQTGIQPIESSASKVASIGDMTKNQQNNSLNFGITLQNSVDNVSKTKYNDAVL